MLLQFRLSVYFLFRHGVGCWGMRRGGCGELRVREKTNNTGDELASKQSDVWRASSTKGQTDWTNEKVERLHHAILLMKLVEWFRQSNLFNTDTKGTKPSVRFTNWGVRIIELGNVWFLVFLGPNKLYVIEGCPYWGVRKERLDCTSLFCKVTDQLSLERNVFPVYQKPQREYKKPCPSLTAQLFNQTCQG